MAAISGWEGQVLIGGATVLPVTRWNVSWKADAIDVTTMATGTGAVLGNLSSPVSAWEVGITDMDCSFDAVWDMTMDPIGSSPPALRAGNLIRASFFLSQANNIAYTFTRVRITEVNIDDEIRGVVKYTVSGKVCSEVINSGALSITFP